MKTYYLDCEGDLALCDDMEEIIDDSERVVKYEDIKEIMLKAEMLDAIDWNNERNFGKPFVSEREFILEAYRKHKAEEAKLAEQKRLEQLEKEAKIGRALLWAVEKEAYIATPMKDGQFDEDDLELLMTLYEESGGK